MKRKRRGAPKKAAAKKPVADKATPAAPVNADEEVFLNFVEQNVEENVAPNEVSNNGVGQFAAAKDISSSLSPSSSSGDGGDSLDIAGDSGWYDGPAAGWRVTRSANKRGWQEMNGEASTRATNSPVVLSRGVDSTAKGKRSMNQKEVPPVKKKPSHDPRYNKAELQACLAVIKKIMKMEEAEKLREHEKRKEQQTSGASSGKADTFCEVMGKETGIIRCGGSTEGKLYGKKQDRSSILKEAWETKRSGDEEVVKKVEAIEQKYTSLEAQMAEINSNVKALIEKMGGMVSKQVNENPPKVHKGNHTLHHRVMQ